MMQEYEQTVHIEDQALEKMRADANYMLTALIRKMIDKDSLEGKLTINIDVSLEKEMVQNTDPSIEGDKRPSYTPSFAHKIGYAFQVKDEMKGENKLDDMELIWDDSMGDFLVRPTTGKDQRTVFDAEFTEVVEPDEMIDDDELIEGPTVPLIGTNDSEDDEKEMLAETGANFLPFEPTDEDYEYENPEGGEE